MMTKLKMLDNEGNEKLGEPSNRICSKMLEFVPN